MKGTIAPVIVDRNSCNVIAEDGNEYNFTRWDLVLPLDFDWLQGGERVEFEIQDEGYGPFAVLVRYRNR